MPLDSENSDQIDVIERLCHAMPGVRLVVVEVSSLSNRLQVVVVISRPEMMYQGASDRSTQRSGEVFEEWICSVLIGYFVFYAVTLMIFLTMQSLRASGKKR